jgi:hypothetical protein
MAKAFGILDILVAVFWDTLLLHGKIQFSTQPGSPSNRVG